MNNNIVFGNAATSVAQRAIDKDVGKFKKTDHDVCLINKTIEYTNYYSVRTNIKYLIAYSIAAIVIAIIGFAIKGGDKFISTIPGVATVSLLITIAEKAIPLIGVSIYKHTKKPSTIDKNINKFLDANPYCPNSPYVE